jgi:ribonuclease P protein component
MPSSILADRPLARPIFNPSRCREADLSAQRAQTQAEARLPCAHGVARRSRDPEAAAREGAQAAVGLSPPQPAHVERRHRLSRSRDFAAVYRHGRSVSTRFLVLHWFPREDGDDGEPRLGLAVPKRVGNAVARNRMKRRLREVWRARLDTLPRGRDYVLVVREGLPEAVEARGFDWLGERVDEVLGKAGA